MSDEAAAAAAADKLSVLASNPEQEEAKDQSQAEDEPSESSSYDEVDDLICSQTDQEENSFYKSLLKGFHSLAELREKKGKPLFTLDPTEEAKPIPENTTKFETAATVNFIDPTTKPNARRTIPW